MKSPPFFGLADGARGDRHDPVDLLRIRQTLEGTEHLHPRLHRLAREYARGERPLAEAHHLLGAVEQREMAVRVDTRDHHVDRVAADVDRGDFHAARAAAREDRPEALTPPLYAG